MQNKCFKQDAKATNIKDNEITALQRGRSASKSGPFQPNLHALGLRVCRSELDIDISLNFLYVLTTLHW
jgi:hypothetical protein